MMKTTKLTHALWVAALTMLFGGCASDNELISPADKDNGNSALLTFTAGTPDDGSAQTRVAYEDMGEDDGKLTWQEGDQLRMGGFNTSGTYKSGLYTYQGTPGETSGNFTGNSVSGVTTYTAYYPATISPDNAGNFTFSMHGQKQQSAAENTAHLRDYMLLQAENITPGGTFTLKMKSSIMKFALSNIPGAVGNLSSLIWTVDTNEGCRSLRLDFEDGIVDFGTGAKSLTAYLGFMPEDMSVKAGGKFSVILVGDKTYRAQVTIANGKIYEAGYRYTATIDGGWTEEALMMFTVKLEAADLDLSMPFNNETLPAETRVDWGDGELSPASSGIADFSHTYSSAGEYTVTVYSAQKDDTQQQIPSLGFKDIGKKLIRIDTPLLNMDHGDVFNCFLNCKNLTSIPENLFAKNRKTISFKGCFSGCYNLTSIPEGLFAKHTNANTFSSCFAYSGLTSIPKGLFAKNTEATDFGNCFESTDLRSIPEGLFDANTNVTRFNRCFINCSYLKSVPKKLFAYNKKATDFGYCFNGCPRLTLNPFIFGATGNPEQEDTERFTGMTMNFASCFERVGTSAGSNAGTAPALWTYVGNEKFTSTNCFKGVNTKLTNYNFIPSDWGGPTIP